MLSQHAVVAVFLCLGAALAVDEGCDSASGHCSSDDAINQSVVLLQSNLLVVNDRTGDNELEEHNPRALLTMRADGGRHKWSPGKAVKKAKEAAKKAADAEAAAKEAAAKAAEAAKEAAECTKQAAAGAENAANDALNALKAASRTKGLVPDCLKNGNVVDCIKADLSSSADWIKNRASALQSGLNILVTSPAYSESYSSLSSSLKDLVKDMKCTSSTSITYPTGIKTDWVPAVRTTSKQICTGIGGLNTNSLKNLQSTFAQCAKGLYNSVATGINAASAAIYANCECELDFGVYYGATVSAAAGVSGSMAAGFIVGCDGCNFKFKPWWSFFGGVTSNGAVDAGLMVGFASSWGAFWGQAWVQAASAGTNVVEVAANVGVGLTLPQLSIQTSTQEVSNQVCVCGKCVTIKKSLDGVPSGISFVHPEFATIDFAITVGVSILPADGSNGFAATYAID